MACIFANEQEDGVLVIGVGKELAADGHPCQLLTDSQRQSFVGQNETVVCKEDRESSIASAKVLSIPRSQDCEAMDRGCKKPFISVSRPIRSRADRLVGIPDRIAVAWSRHMHVVHSMVS